MSKIICSIFTHFGLGLGGGLVYDQTKLDLISKSLGESTTLHKFGGKIQVKLQICVN